MAAGLLDKLDHEHDGAARRYLASLYAFGASHEQAAEKLAQEFGIRQPTKRSTGEWRRTDVKLRQMIEQLEAAKADLAPDAAPADVLANVPAPVDPAEATGALFDLANAHPAFAALLARPDDDEFDGDAAVSQVLAAEHDSDEALKPPARRWSVTGIPTPLSRARAPSPNPRSSSARSTLLRGSIPTISPS
jgi:hypothetical protein